ncbi:MAG: hypothetical protein IJP17_02530 [Clostridia bacterium]|nr:hypothetical protein [Clostridia bacterium]
MDIFAYLSCGLVACVLIVIVRQYRADMAVVLSIGAGVVMLAFALSSLAPVMTGLRDIVESAGVGEEWLSVIVKAFGISVKEQLAADVCRDVGESSLAGKIEIGGRVAILAVSLPLFQKVLELSAKIITG